MLLKILNWSSGDTEMLLKIGSDDPEALFQESRRCTTYQETPVKSVGVDKYI